MSVSIDFNKTLEFTYGECDQLSPLVRRVIANNPGPFTFTGTGTYLIGRGNVAVIDPGPADRQHIDAILKATAGEIITHILITHAHVDHSQGCEMLQAHCGAKTWAFSQSSDDAAARSFGLDTDFVPDRSIADGECISGENWQLQCLHTPGHSSDHMSFYLEAEDALFCGDVVMGWSTTIVSPPDGNMADYMTSLQRLMSRSDSIYYPTHGAPIPQPKSYVSQLHQHRQQREDQVLDCIRSGANTLSAMVPMVYSELNPAMYGAASRSLLATIEYLVDCGRLTVADDRQNESSYALAD